MWLGSFLPWCLVFLAKLIPWFFPDFQLIPGWETEVFSHFPGVFLGKGKSFFQSSKYEYRLWFILQPFLWRTFKILIKKMFLMLILCGRWKLPHYSRFLEQILDFPRIFPVDFHSLMNPGFYRSRHHAFFLTRSNLSIYRHNSSKFNKFWRKKLF